MDLSTQLVKEKIPRHIAIIMDGNGRWAKKQGAMRLFGHQSAITSVREASEGCAELGVEFLTLYAFSTENWGRPADEVNGLMDLLVATISAEIPTLMKNDIRLGTIGDIQALPAHCRQKLQDGIDETAGNKKMLLTLALNYSGRWELTQAVKAMAQHAKDGEIDPNNINEELIAQYLSTSHMPDPELLIRTSGELRVSNFLLWQIAYTELFITDILWPDFRREHLQEAIQSYQSRQRRFGKVLEEPQWDII